MVSRRVTAWLLAVLLALIAGLCWYVNKRPPSAPLANTASSEARRSFETPRATPDPRQTRVVPAGNDGRTLLPEAAELARTLNAPGGSAEQDTQTLTTLVGLFRRANEGAIPAGGLNEEITEQMLGKNARHFAVLPADCPGLDAAGRLCDRWGTPYFLHPLSREILEIRSAGPDRKFGTEDDIAGDESAGAGIRR